MPSVMTWVRPVDIEHFAPIFARYPTLRFLDAQADRALAPGIGEALLLTGGGDLSAPYHREPPRDLSLIRWQEPERDAWEMAALSAALEDGRPILAICRGMQLLNVAFGGTLHLDISGHSAPEMKSCQCQPLRHDTRASYQFERVNSSHHQAVDRLGDGLRVDSWSAGDDVVEQIRLPGAKYVVGLQYHPERAAIYQPIFDDFAAVVQELDG